MPVELIVGLLLMGFVPFAIIIFVAWRMGRKKTYPSKAAHTRYQKRCWYLSHFQFFSPRQMLIPFSTVVKSHFVEDSVYYVLNVYVFGFRVVQLHRITP